MQSETSSDSGSLSFDMEKDCEQGLDNAESRPEGLSDVAPITTIGMLDLTPVQTQHTKAEVEPSAIVELGVTTDAEFMVDWSVVDDQDPKNWPTWRKCAIVFSCTVSSSTW